ncbi:MAG TPA: hypothetical protein PK113_05980, partial [Bacillota bacterium]|nr:hypothetical protein [Bacillota bacterium]
YSGFREHLKTRWNELYDNQIQGLIDSVYPTAGSIAKSRYMNFERWDIIGTWYDWYTAPEIFNCKTYEDQVGFMYDFLVTRILWLNEQINDF